MRSLVINKFIPWPPNGGDKRRTLGVSRALQALGEVSICGFTTADEDPEPLRREGFDVLDVPLRRSVSSTATGLIRSRSLTSARFWDGRLAEQVRSAARHAEVVVVEHVQLLPYLALVDKGPVIVLDMHNVESFLTRRYADTQHGVKRLALEAESRNLRRLERRARVVDVIAVVSALDGELLAGILPEVSPIIVANAWDEPTPLPPAEDPVVTFVAMFSWAPNIDAARWFTRNVWPHVLSKRPDARLELVGRNPAAAVRALVSDSVAVTGTVPDLVPFYARSSVAIAPLRSGGGSRLKILEALSFGRPVVASSIGAEGLEDLIGRGVFVADGALEMAQIVVRLLNSPAMAATHGEIGARAVADDHSWTKATAPLLDLLKQPLEIVG